MKTLRHTITAPTHTVAFLLGDEVDEVVGHTPMQIGTMVQWPSRATMLLLQRRRQIAERSRSP